MPCPAPHVSKKPVLCITGAQVCFEQRAPRQTTVMEGLVTPLEQLVVYPGEVAVVIGESGSGKTTLLNFIMGFYRAPSLSYQEKLLRRLALPQVRTRVKGHVIISGADVSRVPPHRRDVGLVMQRFSLYPHMTVEGNFEFPLRYRMRPLSRDREGFLRDIIAKVGLLSRCKRFGTGNVLRKYPDQLSAGQAQRVAIAKLFVREPSVALFDEAFAHLDTSLQRDLWSYVKRYALTEGRERCVLFVTHDVRQLAKDDDIAKIIAIGRAGQRHAVFERNRERGVSAFEQFANSDHPAVGLLR
jgi:ABC-type sugar transport system ATPase subunit